MIELARALRAEVEGAAVRLRGFGETDVARNRGPGKWTKKEVLGHLIDSGTNNHQRFVPAQFVNPFIWPRYDQQSWVSLHRYCDLPWAELVDLWAALNRHVAVVIESVPAEKLQTPCTIGEHEPAPLEWWMRDYLRHLRHHLTQIAGE